MSGNSVYVNAHLMVQNKLLLTKCKDFKKNANVKYLWANNGKIHMRKADNSKLFVISNQQCLSDVH